MEKQAGDSSEQRDAEILLLNLFSQRLGVILNKKRISLPEGSRIELDGFCESPPIVCEAWAHIGSPKSAQKSKVMKDAFKLDFARRLLNNKTKCYIIFADSEAASQFLSKTWMAQCLKIYDINIEVIELPLEVKNRVLDAQKRQFR